MTIIITGGAGFIGSHVVRLFVQKYPDYKIINLDALTYAGNLENLRDIESAPNYTFIKADITDAEAMQSLFFEHKPDGVIHLAAESQCLSADQHYGHCQPTECCPCCMEW
jgi:dTDP-glucose 4,6-dehydratase